VVVAAVVAAVVVAVGVGVVGGVLACVFLFFSDLQPTTSCFLFVSCGNGVSKAGWFTADFPSLTWQTRPDSILLLLLTIAARCVIVAS